MANSLHRAFTEHPASVGESYAQHCAQAYGFGWRMVLGGLACMVHAVFPALFVCTGSQTILKLHDRMLVNRKKQSACEALAARTATASTTTARTTSG